MVCKGGTRGGTRRELRSLPKPTGLVIRRTRRLKEVFLNIPMLQQHRAAVRVELLSTPPSAGVADQHATSDPDTLRRLEA